jgi:hypothetical protein
MVTKEGSKMLTKATHSGSLVTYVDNHGWRPYEKETPVICSKTTPGDFCFFLITNQLRGINSFAFHRSRNIQIF